MTSALPITIKEDWKSKGFSHYPYMMVNRAKTGMVTNDIIVNIVYLTLMA